MQSEKTWTTRETTDKARHFAACAVCRDKIRPRGDEKIWGVKNARTRQFVHILINGESLESKLGWPQSEILYSLLVEDGAAKGPPMMEDVKARLRAAAAERKLKKALRTNTPARLAEGGRGEKEDGMVKRKMTGTRRMLVFGDIPATKVMRWMGKCNFTEEEVASALKIIKIEGGLPTKRHIRDCLRDGKLPDKPIVNLTVEQEKILRDALKKSKGEKQ